MESAPADTDWGVLNSWSRETVESLLLEVF